MAVDDLVEARDELAEARAVVADCERDLRRSVRESLDEGVPAARIGEVLGLSRARVYQLRAEAR